MRTLRSRLLLGTAAGTALILGGSGVLLYALVHQALWREFDESLAAKACSLAAMIEYERNRLDLEFDEANLPEFEPSDHAEFYQVWYGTRVFARSPSLKGRNLALIRGTPAQPGYQSVVLPDGRPGRLVGISLIPRREDNEERNADHVPVVATLVVGRETKGLENTLAQLRAVMVVVGLATVLVTVGVLAWSVRRGLRPVDRLASQIADVGESDLTARIAPCDVPSELLPIVERLNDLLGRLESAFRRESRFTADVAHELRTPLAGMRATLEVTLAKQRDPEAYQQAMNDCLAITQQMHQMVENLLSLARTDAHQQEIARETIDLSALVKACWKPLAPRAAQRQLHVDWRLQEPCTLESDRGKLQLILQNILGNAVTYTNENGWIRIELTSHDEQVTLTITNTGNTVPREDIGRVFDRFWRGDVSRQSVGHHCGLGLPLCKTLVELLGGSISAHVTPTEEFMVTIVFSRGTGPEKSSQPTSAEGVSGPPVK